MNREETIDFLECRRAYYTSLSTDPNPHVKATKVCGYTLAESANACLMAIEALKRESVLDKARAEIKAIAINGQLDEHTMFMRAEEQVKQMAKENK